MLPTSSAQNGLGSGSSSDPLRETRSNDREVGERHAVLLVDDDPALVETLSAIMEQRYEVSATTSPLVALSRVEQQDFVVVISDLNMPGLDGLELLRRARRSSAAIGCILMTGRSERLSTELRSDDRKWLAVLSKPFELDRLFDKVDQLAAVAMMKRSVQKMKIPADVRR
jgi:DNA-binding NtrC family response regulator